MGFLKRSWAGYRNFLGQQKSALGKLIVAGVPFFCTLCLFCWGCSTIWSLMPGASERASATTEARKVQATARAIETENAQVIRTLTAAARPATSSVDVMATATFFAEQVNATQTAEALQSFAVVASATPDELTSTPTIYYIVVTGEPTDTREPTRRPPTRVPPTATLSPWAGRCDPAYPNVCIPSTPKLNCDDIGVHDFVVLPPDPQDFDRNSNGIGCES